MTPGFMAQVEGECEGDVQLLCPLDLTWCHDDRLTPWCPACRKVAYDRHSLGCVPFPCIGSDPCLPASLVGEDCGGEA